MIREKIDPPREEPDDFGDQVGNEGLRQSLLAKLDGASELVDKAYMKDKLNMLNGAKGQIRAFINELESDNEASKYSKAGECILFANNIIQWIEESE